MLFQSHPGAVSTKPEAKLWTDLTPFRRSAALVHSAAPFRSPHPAAFLQLPTISWK